MNRVGGLVRTLKNSKPCSCSILRAKRPFSTTAEPREVMEYDVVIVGAGPAGLASAIRLKQLCSREGAGDLSVCVVEKGAEVGAHILSGNVFETRALDELIPDWKERGAPIDCPVTEDAFMFLTETKSYRLPNALLPKELHNDRNHVISLSQLVRWMASQAEELGVEIYPGFAAAEVLYGDSGAVEGIATRDVGIGKDGKPKGTYQRGIELRAKQTLFAEGAKGSCSEEVMETFKLREGVQPQSFGLGIKEIWQIPAENCKPGLVAHTLGWPLQRGPLETTFGGSFLYHLGPDMVLLGIVVGTDYKNAYLNPYKEFQRLKHHPEISKHLKGGRCISYGARILNEGGWHAMPKLSFPGGAILGCAAGTLNSVKIKGAHTAIKSGSVAAEAVYDALVDTEGALKDDAQAVTTDFDTRLRESWVGEELKAVRNCHASFHGGLLPGLMYTGLTAHLLRGREPWTLGKNAVPDSAKTEPVTSSASRPIEYPKPDGVLSFDILTNLERSGTNHEHDQPSHLRIKENMKEVPSSVSLKEFAGPEQRFCPAAVYEYQEGELVINAQNCLHCKCCAVKTPKEYIDWTVPEGGGGPAYTIM